MLKKDQRPEDNDEVSPQECLITKSKALEKEDQPMRPKGTSWANLNSKRANKIEVMDWGAIVGAEGEEVRKEGKEGWVREWVRTSSYRCWVTATSAIWGYTPKTPSPCTLHPSTYLSAPLNTFRRICSQRRTEYC